MDPGASLPLVRSCRRRAPDRRDSVHRRVIVILTAAIKNRLSRDVVFCHRLGPSCARGPGESLPAEIPGYPCSRHDQRPAALDVRASRLRRDTIFALIIHLGRASPMRSGAGADSCRMRLARVYTPAV